MKAPNAFIVGAPKCGTTSLAAWLAQHPAIYMAPVKEPAYFAADLKAVRPTRPEYEALFAAVDDRHQVVAEASTCYLFSQIAIPSIVRHLGRARLIVCLRSPVEMAPSLHRQELYTLDEDVADFAAAWRLQDVRRAGRHLPRTCREPWLLRYADRCRLGEQVGRLLDTIPREQVLFVLLDDVRADPGAQYRRVLAFLGVPDDGRTVFPAYNGAKGVRSRALKEGVRRIAGLRRSIGFTQPLGMRTWLERWNTRRVAPEALNAGTAAMLREWCADDVRALGRLIGRDLSRWLRER